MRHEKSINVACVQYCATDNIERNMEWAASLIARACDEGANYIALPEACDFLSEDGMKAYARPENEHQALQFLCREAKSRRIWLLVGSLTVAGDEGKLANRSYVIDPLGQVVARYDKIHMFDAHVGGAEVYRESATYQPGSRSVTVEVPGARLGLSICYDLRFPTLYRSLAKSGATLLSVPAAFTQTTGEAHWHVLLRSRAIENGCFVIAAGQCGSPYSGRQSYGHSLIIDPWGRVLAEAGAEEDVIVARLDMDRVEQARASISSLFHDREFSGANSEAAMRGDLSGFAGV